VPEMGARRVTVKPRFLGRRGTAVPNARSAVFDGRVGRIKDGLDAVTGTMLPALPRSCGGNVTVPAASRLRRTPELSFFQLHKDTPLKKIQVIAEGKRNGESFSGDDPRQRALP